MKPGRYDWPFNLRLPPFLPSSFEGQYGRVQYWAKAVIDRPWKGDTDFTRNFTVLGQLDLNTEEDARVRAIFRILQLKGQSRKNQCEL